MNSILPSALAAAMLSVISVPAGAQTTTGAMPPASAASAAPASSAAPDMSSMRGHDR